MKHLLDVSTVIALLWQKHEHHERAKSWWQSVRHAALCPVSELGWLRISTTPAFNVGMKDSRRLLEDFKAKVDWVPCDLPALEGLAAKFSKDTTDFYLANLAAKHGMRWATLELNPTHPAALSIPLEHPAAE